MSIDLKVLYDSVPQQQLLATMAIRSYDKRVAGKREVSVSAIEKNSASSVEVLRSVADLVEIAGNMAASTVIVAGGDRVEDLRLVESARDHGIIDRIILVGKKDRITQAVDDVGIEIASDDIVHAEKDEETARITAERVRSGGIDIILKGNISTPVLNKHMLPLAVRPTVSLVSVFDAAPLAGGRPMVLSDAGVTTVCNLGRMVDLVRNAVDVAHVVMGLERPRVAILSANEKQVPSLPSTWMGAKLTERQWSDAVVYGPLSFDLATDPDSVGLKGLPSAAAQEVAGKADILVCPGIDSANVLYKMITAMIKYGQASLAGITVGLPVPYIILSRADNLQTRLESIALSSIYAQRTRHQDVGSGLVSAVSVERVYRVLAVNPGSTSTKLAVYENDSCVKYEETSQSPPALTTPAERSAEVTRQVELILERLGQWGLSSLDAVVGRGGFLPRPSEKLAAGVYRLVDVRDGRAVMDDVIVRAVLDRAEKEHASNLGIPVAAEAARSLGIPAFCVDPVVVDEFIPEAEISGYAPIVRRSTSHALSIRSATRLAARSVGRPVEDINLVVAHLGGGITVAAIRQGRMIDNNIALLGGGPFSPQRVGELPMGELIDLCYSGSYSKAALIHELTQRGGLQSYLGEHRMEIIEKRIADGDAKARLIVEAMAYQIAKAIGAMVAAVGGDIEAIVLTGGLVHSALFSGAIRQRVGRMAPVLQFAGSLEMVAMAEGAIAVLSGKEEGRHYQPPE